MKHETTAIQHVNLSLSELVTAALDRKEGVLSANRALAVVTGKTITFCEDCGSRGFGHLYLLGVDYSKCPECGSKMITIDESEKHLYPYIKGTIFETPLFEFMEKRKRMIKISLRGGRGD